MIPEQRNLHAAAIALILSAPVFTRLVMYNGVQRLIEISESATEQQKADASGEALKLLQAWVSQNFVRAAVAFGAGMVGLYALQSLKEKTHLS